MTLIALLLAAGTAATPTEAPPLPQLGAAGDFNPLAKGSLAFSFSLPGDAGAPSIGATYFVADGMAAKFDFGLNAIFAPGGQPATFGIDFALRWYNWKHGQVALFVSPEFGFGRVAAPAAGGSEYLFFAGALGVEYFFTDRLSAGAQLGLALNLTNIGANTGSTGVALNTGTTGLFASIYF